MVAGLETDEQSARRLADLVTESFAADEVAVSLVGNGPFAGQGRSPQRRGSGAWRVNVYCRAGADIRIIRELAAVAGGAAMAKALAFERLTAKDWVGLSLTGLKPVAAGRFVVHGAHDRGSVPPNRIGIEIEAALAFGTGHHGTTRGCLLALDSMCKSMRGGSAAPRILDLGTGSGVLAIAAARALHARVLATDIDAVAVRAARDNARRNRAGRLVEVVKSDGVAAPGIRRHAPFDLVFANILLGPLQRLAAPLAKIVTPGGHVVLSGLLTAQANAALAAYGAFRLERRIMLDGWATLVLRCPSRTSIARRHDDPYIAPHVRGAFSIVRRSRRARQ
jgi:ribosomal protein L11 methyltransferase